MKKILYITFVDWDTEKVCHKFSYDEWDKLDKYEKRAFTSEARYMMRYSYE